MAKSTSIFFFLHIPTNTYVKNQRKRYNYTDIESVSLTDNKIEADSWRTLKGIRSIARVFKDTISDQFCILETDTQHNEISRTPLQPTSSADIASWFHAFCTVESTSLDIKIRNTGKLRVSKGNNFCICTSRTGEWVYKYTDTKSTTDIKEVFKHISAKW